MNKIIHPLVGSYCGKIKQKIIDINYLLIIQSAYKLFIATIILVYSNHNSHLLIKLINYTHFYKMPTKDLLQNINNNKIIDHYIKPYKVISINELVNNYSNNSHIRKYTIIMANIIF